MSNEIITQQIMPPGMLAVGQTGKNNVNVTNQQGGIVNFNYNIQQGAVIGRWLFTASVSSTISS